MYHMIVEQTRWYSRRMVYHPETGTFSESEYASLMYVRNIRQPYGWIRESGTPPEPHWDVFLMTEDECELGEELPIRIIGVFLRGGGDHKFIAVRPEREIYDYDQLEDSEKEDLRRLYPRIDEGGGWFGREEAERILAE